MDRMLLNDSELCEIKRMYGQILVAVLRQVYGPGFADNAGNELTLNEALPDLDQRSLSLLRTDFGAGRLRDKLSPYSAT